MVQVYDRRALEFLDDIKRSNNTGQLLAQNLASARPQKIDTENGQTSLRPEHEQMIEDFGEFGSKLKSFGDKLKADTTVLAPKNRKGHTRDIKTDLMEFMMGERMDSGKSPRIGLTDSKEDISDFVKQEDQLSETG